MAFTIEVGVRQGSAYIGSIGALCQNFHEIRKGHIFEKDFTVSVSGQERTLVERLFPDIPKVANRSDRLVIYTQPWSGFIVANLREGDY